MIRSIAFTLLIVILPGASYALGLGKLDLKSKLNEPFEAHIELLSATADELDSLKVNLASPEDFRRAGVERSFNLTKLKFQLKETPKGSDYIRIYSKDSIREPFLNFLVEINWNRGRLLREYTSLLDPPTYSPIVRPQQSAVQPKPIPVVPKQPVAPTVRTEPVVLPSATESLNPPAKFIDQGSHNVVYDLSYQKTLSTPQQPSAAPQTFTPYSGGDYNTSRGDTLWGIASQMRPDNSVSIQQTMLAMYRANPEAFVNNNINNLKTGQVLSSPDISDIKSLSKSEAIEQVADHNDLWQGVKQALAETATERPDSTGMSLPSEDSSDSSALPTETMPTESEPELRLVGSEDSSTGVGQGAGDSGSDSAVVGEDLALVEESLVALESENKELKEKLIEAESIIDDLNRLIVLKEDELSVLKQQLSVGVPTEPAMEETLDVMEDELPEEILPEEMPGEEMMDDMSDDMSVVEESSAIDDSSSFIIEEELPESDPEQYGELYSEDPGMEEPFPGESDFTEQEALESEADPFMDEELPEEVVDEEVMDEELLPEEPMEPMEEEVTEQVTEVESDTDTGLGAVSGVMDTLKQYFSPIVDFAKENIELLGKALGGLLVLFLGFLGFKKFRGGKEEVLELDDEDDILNFDDADTEAVDLTQAGKDPATDQTLVMDAPIDLAATDSTGFDPERTAANDFSDSQPPGFAEPQNLDDPDEDPLAEVNVFLAYEHFDQAEEFVKKALQDQPDNLDFHTKLLEVFYAAGDKKAYEDAARVLRDKFSDSGEHWDNALAMWSEMSPNREIFSERMDGLDDTQALAPGSAEEALSSGIVDLTADESGVGTESDIVETSADVLDITGQNLMSNSQPASAESEDLLNTLSEASDLDTLSDENILDVSTNGSDDGHLLDFSSSDEANIIDSSLPMESTEHILDLTGGDGAEDILDITAGSQEDLLDITASTDLDALPSITRKSDIDEESTLDFDVQGLDLDVPSDDTSASAATDESEFSTIERAMDTIDATEITTPAPDKSVEEDTVVDFDLPLGDTESTAASLDLDVSGAFDLGTPGEGASSEQEVNIELDTELSTADEKTVEMTAAERPDIADNDEPSLDVDLSDEVTLDFDSAGEDTDDLKNDLGESVASNGSGGVEMDLTNEFTLDEENTDSLSDGFDLELQDEEEMIPNTELDIDMEGTVEMPSGTVDAPTVEMPKVDYVDDEDDKTVFIPRSASSEQQSLEDEVSTKLDLAKAYVELGDNDSAKTILDEIVAEGNDEQKQIAQQLLTQVT